MRSLLSHKNARLCLTLSVVSALLFGGCLRQQEGEQFYGKVAVPSSQEFRWSDGGLPKVFDPARAAAPPDTDVVRALFEGLTDYEPGTLRPVAAVASRWEESEGGRVWTFHLRPDAQWSNGDDVTAQDFVRSWARTLRLGERAPHSKLLSNIEGAQAVAQMYSPQSQNGAKASTPQTPSQPQTLSQTQTPSTSTRTQTTAQSTQSQSMQSQSTHSQSTQSQSAQAQSSQPTLGAVALDARTLRVTLVRPDRNFPSLVAHPVFRPVHELSPGAGLSELRDEQAQGGEGAGLSIVTNGAFSLSRLAGDSVELERASGYWDAASVRLERVLFVNKSDPEEALAAYRAGELDAVTNAPVEPLAVKLLTPYKDFRRETFAALNYYHFNSARAPFDDPRVREALARAIDTERLSADTLGGATEAARGFLPKTDAGEETASADGQNQTVEARPDGEKGARPDPSAALVVGEGERRDAGGVGALGYDAQRARSLLAEAGFAGGAGFPRVRLLVNRNEQQRLVAQAVARMWRDTLGIETEILVRPWEEYEAALRAGEYDVARRSLVMQTTDEETNMIELFGEDSSAEESSRASVAQQPSTGANAAGADGVSSNSTAAASRRETSILTEAQALREVPAIPLHFASSYALVKPYVSGFESNLLDAPSLKSVQIDTQWRPPAEAQATVVSRR
jgi:ABC-type oligopeptide transport system substrate-binding subunit